jgi:hypothetical protein
VTGLYQESTLRVQVPPRTGLTPYARHGRAVEAGLVGVTVGGILLAGLLWRRRRGGAGRPAPKEQAIPDRGMAPPVGGRS